MAQENNPINAKQNLNHVVTISVTLDLCNTSIPMIAYLTVCSFRLALSICHHNKLDTPVISLIVLQPLLHL